MVTVSRQHETITMDGLQNELVGDWLKVVRNRGLTIRVLMKKQGMFVLGVRSVIHSMNLLRII
jgi:hypothetical protein